MKRRAPGSRAFSKIKAGLEDAIAYHRGKALLTVRDVELKPPAAHESEWTLSQSARGCACHRPRSPES